MKILVTGGAGFIGSNFVHYWLKNYPKDSVTVLDKLTYAGHLSSLRQLNKNPGFKFVKGDICDSALVDRLTKNTDVLVHFAAESHVDRSIMNPSIFLTTNILGTQVLLESALRSGVKLFHHISTDEVFGELPLDKPEMKFNDHTAYSPNSPYSASKASSDFLVRVWYKTYGLPVTITNTSNNFGPYQDPEKLIPRFITNLIEGKKLPLMGKGENIRDWCYVEDHCRAIDLIVHSALTNPKLIGQSFCVGGNSERTNYQVTMEILRFFDRDETWIEYVPHRLGHDSRYAIDSGKITSLLNWSPGLSFSLNLALTVKWYLENEWWWKPLKKDRPNIDPYEQKKIIRK